MTTTSHYGFTLPQNLGDNGIWGTELNGSITNIDSTIWSISAGMFQGVNSQTSSASIVLTNPVVTQQNMNFTLSGQSLILPAMNATNSAQTGGVITVTNSGSISFSIKANDATTVIVATVYPGQTVNLAITSNSTANGSFLVSGSKIVGETIDATPIGSTTPSTGVFTTLSATTSASSPSITASTLLSATTQATVGTNTANGTNALTVVQAGAAQAYFGSTGTNASNIAIDTATTGQPSQVYLSDAGSAKWAIAKNADLSFSVYDTAAATNTIRVTTNSGSAGTVILGHAQNFVIDHLGNATTITQSGTDNSTKVATTAQVQAAITASSTVKTVKVQTFISSGTYTPSTGMVYCFVEICGGGGGGGNGGSTNGGNSTFGALLTANGGKATGSPYFGAGGTGGTGGTGISGGSGSLSNGSGVGVPGGSCPMPGTSVGPANSSPTFYGGGGGGANSVGYEGGGGGGEYRFATFPSATIGASKTVTLGGAGGGSGAGNGGSGLCRITEYCSQ